MTMRAECRLVGWSLSDFMECPMHSRLKPKLCFAFVAVGHIQPLILHVFAKVNPVFNPAIWARRCQAHPFPPLTVSIFTDSVCLFSFIVCSPLLSRWRQDQKRISSHQPFLFSDQDAYIVLKRCYPTIVRALVAFNVGGADLSRLHNLKDSVYRFFGRFKSIVIFNNDSFHVGSLILKRIEVESVVRR